MENPFIRQMRLWAALRELWPDEADGRLLAMLTRSLPTGSDETVLRLYKSWLAIPKEFRELEYVVWEDEEPFG